MKEQEEEKRRAYIVKFDSSNIMVIFYQFISYSQRME